MIKVLFTIFLLFVFLGETLASTVKHSSTELDGKIREASQRIIVLMKGKNLTNQIKVLDIVEQWKVNMHDKAKQLILQRIQYFIGGFVRCQEENGEWLEKYFECEYIKKDVCTEIGGVYFQCTSACRHTNRQICLLPCKEVCTLSE